MGNVPDAIEEVRKLKTGMPKLYYAHRILKGGWHGE
jgi:hypothetical protein